MKNLVRKRLKLKKFPVKYIHWQAAKLRNVRHTFNNKQRLRVNPNSLSYPFSLVLRVHVRVTSNAFTPRLNQEFSRGYLKPKGTQNTLRPDHSESIFVLNNLFKITTVLFCALHSPVTYIYICNHTLNWNVF